MIETPQGCCTDTLILQNSNIIFVEADIGSERLVEDHQKTFFSHLSLLEISLRMEKRLPPTTLKEAQRRFKQYVYQGVMKWNYEEKRNVTEVLDTVLSRFSIYMPSMIPVQIYVVKSNGREEGEAFFTRNNTLVIPMGNLKILETKDGKEQVANTLVHECAHIFSKEHALAREKVYHLLGYKQVGKINLGKFLEERKITTPDGTNTKYIVTLEDRSGKQVLALPFLYSRCSQHVPGKTIYDCMSLEFFEVKRIGIGQYEVLGKDGIPISLDMNLMKGFYEKIGRNTDYIIHPDEIFADNVALLLKTKINPIIRDRLDSKGLFVLDSIDHILSRYSRK